MYISERKPLAVLIDYDGCRVVYELTEFPPPRRLYMPIYKNMIVLSSNECVTPIRESVREFVLTNLETPDYGWRLTPDEEPKSAFVYLRVTW